MLHIKESESGGIKPQLPHASPRRTNSIKSITKFLVSANCQNLSTGILSDYTIYVLDFQCFQLQLAKCGYDRYHLIIFSDLFSMVSLFSNPTHLHECMCVHTHKYTNAHMHINAHAFMWPVWPSLLYLISSFLDSAAACSFQCYVYPHCTHCIQTVFKFCRQAPVLSLFSLLPSLFHSFLLPTPNCLVVKLWQIFSHGRYMSSFSKSLHLFQDDRHLHWVMFYEGSGLGWVDSSGFMHRSTPRHTTPRAESHLVHLYCTLFPCPPLLRMSSFCSACSLEESVCFQY